MARISFFNIHRNWEDWLAMLVGVLIGLSPWLAGQQDNQVVMWNAIIVGALVIALAALELANLQRWEEAGEMACGMWLIASPFIFGYAGAGALKILALRPRRDCRTAGSDRAMAGLEAQRHGACPARAVSDRSAWFRHRAGLRRFCRRL